MVTAGSIGRAVSLPDFLQAPAFETKRTINNMRFMARSVVQVAPGYERYDHDIACFAPIVNVGVARPLTWADSSSTETSGHCAEGR